MPDSMQRLIRSHDGPIPPAERAAARWGAGAWRRLGRGADAALLEARLGACATALTRLRRHSGLAARDALERLVRGVAGYWRAAASVR